MIICSGVAQINDVTAGDSDGRLLSFAATKCVPVVLMHSRGTPKTMDDMVRCY